MKVEDAKVTLGVEEIKLIDKKLREKLIKKEKPLIILDDKTIFSNQDRVKVVDYTDFEKLGTILKEFREDKKSLMQQLNIMEDILEDKKNQILVLEADLDRLKKSSSSGMKDRIKNLI